MFAKIKFWLECSRWYTLPMSIFSWLVIFVYAINNGGNALYGFIALMGICLAHLATNLFDDYCDFKILKKRISGNNIELPNTQRGKCKYILNGRTTLNAVLKVVFLYCFLAFSIGVFFCLSVGFETIYFIISGGAIVLFYSFLSNRRFSEIAVGLAFGAILFCGVYYVMTGEIRPDAFILSIPVSIFTVNLLYTDTFLDREIDRKEGKKTFVALFETDKGAILFQKIFIGAGYFSICLLPYFNISDWKIVLTIFTIPFAIDLIKSLELYTKNITPQKRWYHFPFENWNDILENRSPDFMFRMYQARNLMIYVSILICISLI